MSDVKRRHFIYYVSEETNRLLKVEELDERTGEATEVEIEFSVDLPESESRTEGFGEVVENLGPKVGRAVTIKPPNLGPKVRRVITFQPQEADSETRDLSFESVEPVKDEQARQKQASKPKGQAKKTKKGAGSPDKK